MGRPKNPESVYDIADAVTKATIHTNPKQFSSMANRMGISELELRTSFVGQKGRRIILNEKLTPEQAVEKYGIHPNVAHKLRCTVKPRLARSPGVTENVECSSEIALDNALEPV